MHILLFTETAIAEDTENITDQISESEACMNLTSNSTLDNTESSVPAIEDVNLVSHENLTHCNAEVIIVNNVLLDTPTEEIMQMYSEDMSLMVRQEQDLEHIENIAVFTEDGVLCPNPADNCQILGETSQNSSRLTKCGTIRKRQAKVKNSVAIKRRKVMDDLASQHKVLEPCSAEKCKKKCTNKVSEDRRISINEQFWKLQWLERRSFILNNCERLEVKRRTTQKENSMRNHSFKYFFKGGDGTKVAVCKIFFLTTLGYKRSNDRVLHDVLSKTPAGNLHPDSDKRGKQPSANKISDVEFSEHLESFKPTISHYRRAHAPNVRYLPADVTVTLMHEDFLKKYPNVKMSYETYRQRVKKMNISFTRLGHEECSVCESLKLHDHDKNNLQEDCDACTTYKTHQDMYTKCRALYQKHADNIKKNENAVHFSADLEKVIMLPRVDTFKEVIFAKRLTVYNECFVPVGEKSKTPPFATVWHEGIAGRCKEELISTFYAFLITQRDSEILEIWLDNCSSQNKNWCLLSFLVFMINSDIISCKEIIINYFEPGHSFMSADSFHHQIENSLKKMGKVYDFNDFCTAVQEANKSHVTMKVMDHVDFYKWLDYSSGIKLKDATRPRLADIVCLKAVRGAFTLQYKKTYEEDEPYKDLNFLKQSAMKKGGMLFPIRKVQPDGFSKKKVENILHNLRNILPENRKPFWRSLPEPTAESAAKRQKSKRLRK